MARLPSEEWLVQILVGQVVVYREGSEEEVVRYELADADATAKAQKTIHDSPLLSDEDKCFAHFWCGYFHAFGGK